MIAPPVDSMRRTRTSRLLFPLVSSIVVFAIYNSSSTAGSVVGSNVGPDRIKPKSPYLRVPSIDDNTGDMNASKSLEETHKPTTHGSLKAEPKDDLPEDFESKAVRPSESSAVTDANEEEENEPSSNLQDTIDIESSVTNTKSPSGWWPNDGWLERCASRQAVKAPKRFPVAKEWEGYRLGDCIKMCTACPTPDKNLEGTLAAEYRNLACYKKDNPNYVFGGNMTAVEEILRQRDGREGFVQPDPDEIVLHLRLGDVIELAEDDVATMLSKGGDAHHPGFFDHSIKSVYEVLQNIAESGSTKVAIMGGSHKPDMCEKSRPYAECLRKAIDAAGYDVRMELDSGNPDHDFYFMSHAKKIVVSTGGYSRLVGDIAVHKGGTIYGRTFPIPED